MYSDMLVIRIGEVPSNNGEPQCQSSSHSRSPPKTGNDPVQQRRAKFVAKLEEQKLLLKDPNHIRSVQRWVKVDGERQGTSSRPSGPGGRSIPRVRLSCPSSSGGQVHRVREGQGRHRRPVQGQASLGMIDALISAVRPESCTSCSAKQPGPNRSARRARRPDYANRVAGPTRHPSGWPICRRLRRQCFSEPHESAHAARPSAP